jgi:hypothetical protein
VRSSAGFGSPDRSFVLGGGSERLNCGKVAEGSFAGRVSERASPAGEVIVRSSAGFGSSDGPSVVSCSSQGLATAGRFLETSPAGRSFTGSSAGCRSSDGPSGAGWSLERLSEAGGTCEGTPLDGGSTVIHD